MALMDHIFRCNKKEFRQYRPLLADEATVIGWIRADRMEILQSYPDIFAVGRVAAALNPDLKTPHQRSDAFAQVAKDLVNRGVFPRLRNELYACKHIWGAPEILRLDRQVVPFFGVKAYGVHVNGWLPTEKGPQLWIGRRARDKAVAPGQLDNMVAGGQPAGLSLMENVIKEAAEEANVSAALAATARPVGSITYCLESPAGLKPDTLFCYDLQVPADFVPQNTDGEMESFELWSAHHAIEALRDGEDFKFNVALVIIDFAIRHGLITPDDEVTYEALVAGLRYPHPQ
jgi:8-oxo-dGTP pyrophosphatase MutT (NUDIX family)